MHRLVSEGCERAHARTASTLPGRSMSPPGSSIETRMTRPSARTSGSGAGASPARAEARAGGQPAWRSVRAGKGVGATAPPLPDRAPVAAAGGPGPHPPGCADQPHGEPPAGLECCCTQGHQVCRHPWHQEQRLLAQMPTVVVVWASTVRVNCAEPCSAPDIIRPFPHVTSR